MFTLPGLLDTKSGLLLYVSWNFFNNAFHLVLWLLSASSGYMSARLEVSGTVFVVVFAMASIVVENWDNAVMC